MYNHEWKEQHSGTSDNLYWYKANQLYDVYEIRPTAEKCINTRCIRCGNE